MRGKTYDFVSIFLLSAFFSRIKHIHAALRGVYRICPFYDETLFLEMRLADLGDPVDIALKGRVGESPGDSLENAQII